MSPSIGSLEASLRFDPDVATPGMPARVSVPLPARRLAPLRGHVAPGPTVFHYRSLDAQGHAPGVVERGYRQVIAGDSSSLDAQAWLIEIMVLQGRLAEAREQVQEALGLWDKRGEGVGALLSRGLLLPVLVISIDRAHIELSAWLLDVARGLDADTDRAGSDFLRLENQLRFDEAAALDELVFPLSIPAGEWWLGPHLLPRQISTGPLIEWWAGRILRIEEEVVLSAVRLAAEAAGAAPSEDAYCYLTLPLAAFPEAPPSLAASRYVEVARYQGTDDPVVKLHPVASPPRFEIPRPQLDPLRYLSAAGLIR